MKMDQHAGAQPRQHLENQEIDLAAQLGGVAGIDEQHVAPLQLEELLEGHRGRATAFEARQARGGGAQPNSRFGIDGDELDGTTLAGVHRTGARADQRREARPQLEQSPRLVVPDHRVQKLGIARSVVAVVEVELPLAGWPIQRRLEFGEVR